MLKIYNSLTQTKEVFTPIKNKEIKLYTCGMTVYDYCHLGHARQMIIFDVMTHYLSYRGYHVKFVRNITDIDDKIITRANENGESIQELTTRFIKAMHEDAAALETSPPDREPKATEYIPDIIKMIETLIQRQFAYVASNGDVYYEISKFTNYGCLSHQKLEDMQAGVRIDPNEDKKNSLDFVLWKASKPNEPAWDSPWGPGRPGWHIECSAMATKELGNHFDIHGGGVDIKFPHHENEIAQSEAATGEKFVNTWMHTGLIQVDDEKMSKSLGNFITIREALAEYRPEEIRYFILSSHYRSPLNYSAANMKAAKASLERFYTALRDLFPADELDDQEYEARFVAAMNDDFNTPEALAVLFELAREINRNKEKDIRRAAKLATLLKNLGGVIGLLQDDPKKFLQANSIDTAKIEALIAERNQARADKNWAESDRVRDELKSMGIVLEDSVNGTTWRKQ